MQMRSAITILDLGYDYRREISMLGKLGVQGTFVPLEGTKDEKAVAEALRGYHFVLAGPEIWSRNVLERLKGDLKMVVRLGAGMDSVDIPAATGLGIAVCSAPGGNACSVAQHTVALMLDLARTISRYDRMMRANEPIRRTMAGDLMLRTVGLVGFGNIARQVAELLSGFHCAILACDTRWDEDAARRLGVRFSPLDELLAASDYVSLHVPLTDETRGMVDAAFLGKMRRGAFLVNTSRGAVIREADLIRALREGTIAGAGLDVFERQPLPAGSELLALPNTVLTPYVAFSSGLGNERTLNMAIGSVEDFLAGRPVRNLINPEYARHPGGR